MDLSDTKIKTKLKKVIKGVSLLMETKLEWPTL